MKTIPVSGGRKEVIVDDSDYEALSKFNWHINNGYACRSIHRGGIRDYVSLARTVMNAPDGMDVDHINGNRLDDRRENLRLVTRKQNNWNRRARHNKKDGLPVGIYKDPWGYRVRFMTNGKVTSFGTFKDLESAKARYNTAAAELRGEYAQAA